MAEQAAQDEDCGVGVFLNLMEDIYWRLEYTYQTNLPVKLGGWRVCFRTLYFTGQMSKCPLTAPTCKVVQKVFLLIFNDFQFK